MIFIMAFLGAITPGPDMLLILQTTLRYGFKRAVITLAGIATGWIVYLGIVCLGFAKLFQSNTAQIILSLIGALYLSYLSYLLLTKPKNNLELNGKKTQDGYLKGLIINLSNPKAILFFGFVIAPFMDKNLFFNLIILFLGLISAFLLIIFIALFFRRFITNKLFNIIDKISAAVFGIFALGLIVRIFTQLI